jgi:hypothetical protein
LINSFEGIAGDRRQAEFIPSVEPDQFNDAWMLGLLENFGLVTEAGFLGGRFRPLGHDSRSAVDVDDHGDVCAW